MGRDTGFALACSHTGTCSGDGGSGAAGAAGGSDPISPSGAGGASPGHLSAGGLCRLLPEPVAVRARLLQSVNQK